MKKKQKQNFALSIEKESILRKFTILFLLMSFLPMSLLYYLYFQIKEYGSVQISEENFNLTLSIIIIGIIVGYFAMRSVIKKVMELAHANRKALEKILSPDKIKELSNEKNEIAVLAKSFKSITQRLEENVQNLKSAKQTLHAVMTKIGHGISNIQNIDTFLELILETITDAFLGEVGVLLVRTEKENELQIRTIHGIKSKRLKKNKISFESESVFADILASKKPRIISDIEPETLELKKYDPLFKPPLLCSPLIVHENCCGIIAVSGKIKSKNFGEDELNQFFNFASQTAVALENSRLNKNIEKTYFETISALALAVDAKDKYSRGHLERVSKYCVQTAEKLGLEEEDINTLRDAAKLHDLGKIGIPDEVLAKKGPLNDQEWALMRKHPEIGESIIKPIRSLNHLCDIIRHHHEKLDGSGYPDGIKGDNITPLVRILTVADIYDALTTNRSYRERMPKEKAYQLLRNMQDQIDQDIVETFIETLEEETLP